MFLLFCVKNLLVIEILRIFLRTTNFSIDEWQVKPANNLLIKAGKEVRIEPKVMELLVYLANKDGKVTFREELLENIWPQIVLDVALTNTIANLRKVLGDTKSPRQYLETITKQGYRLIPTVNWDVEADINDESPAPIEPVIVDAETTDKKSLFNTKSFSFITILFLVVAFVLFQSQQTLQIETQTDAEEKLKTLAVLPFDVFDDESNLHFYADGLVEELIHQLAANPSFRVISRTSSASFKGTKTDIKTISEVLGARYVIEGSIRQSRPTLRVTVQLIDAENGYHLWSKIF